jgi:hypothetical protein
MRQLSLVFLLLATALHAQDAPREIFPADFTPSPCALETSCISFPDSSMGSAAYQFLALQLDQVWDAKHAPELKAAMAPLCRKHATCQTYPMNTYTFCDDVLAQDSRPLCDKMFPRAKNGHDWEQCNQWLETYLMGIDQNAINTWKAAQACAKKQPAAATHTKPLDVWMSPNPVPYEYKGYVTFYSIDPDTHVPVLARVILQDQLIYAPSNPTGESATFYPFIMPFKSVRVPNKEGHTDAATPLITVTVPGYPDTSFRLPAILPHAVVEMKPALHAGKNEVTVVARDSINGKPVDGRVMVGDDEVGFANQPITIEIKPKSKRQEIWLKPYLNRYNDVVIVPAER